MKSLALQIDQLVVHFTLVARGRWEIFALTRRLPGGRVTGVTGFIAIFLYQTFLPTNRL